MNIRQDIQKQISTACKTAHIYPKVFIGAPHELKKLFKVQLDTSFGADYLKDADYLVVYIVPSAMNEAILKKIADANETIAAGAFTVPDFKEIRFPQQDNNKSYVVQKITKTQISRFNTSEEAAPTPAAGVEGTEDGGEHPLEAITYAEENNLGPNQTIIGSFTPEAKTKLEKLIKHNEFTPLEAAVLKALMSEEANLQDLGVMLGAKSKKTNGQPMSKVAAFKQLNRIFEIIAKRSAIKLGKKIDLAKLAEYKKAMKQAEIDKKKNAKDAKQKYKEAYKEFWTLLHELNQEQRAHGLKPSRYDKAWNNPTSLDAMRDVKGDHFEEA